MPSPGRQEGELRSGILVTMITKVTGVRGRKEREGPFNPFQHPLSGLGCAVYILTLLQRTAKRPSPQLIPAPQHTCGGLQGALRAPRTGSGGLVKGRESAGWKEKPGGGGGLDRQANGRSVLQMELRESSGTRCSGARSVLGRPCSFVAPPSEGLSGAGSALAFPPLLFDNTAKYRWQDEAKLRCTTLHLHLSFQLNQPTYAN
jgi:hypothetical protein